MRIEGLSAELQAIDDRMRNWGRWAMDQAGPSRAQSAEGRFIRERLDEATEDERRRPSVQIDAQDASKIDRCVSPATGFPTRWSILLKTIYVWRADAWVVCRKARVPKSELDHEWVKALHAVHNRMARFERG